MDKLRQHIEQITSLTDEEFDYIKTFFILKKLKKHQYLVQEGDPVYFEYLVISGIFRVFYSNNEGKESTVQLAAENWWMCDYYAFFYQQKGKLHVTCMEEGEVLCLNLDARETLSARFPKMEHFFRVKANKGYAGLQRRIISLLACTPLERYEEFCALHPYLLDKIPKKYIAEYLGVSRETLSRLNSRNK